MCSHIIHSLSPLYWLVFFLLFFAQVLLVLHLALRLRRSEMMPPPVVQLFGLFAEGGDVRDARLLTRLQSSALTELMGVGLARLDDVRDARCSMRRRAESIRVRWEMSLRYLAILGTLGPVIGMFGTVYGIIQSFMRLGCP